MDLEGFSESAFSAAPERAWTAADARTGEKHRLALRRRCSLGLGSIASLSSLS
jgi:hypothetical protein